LEKIKLTLTLLNIPGIGRMRTKMILSHYQSGMDLTEVIQMLFPRLSIDSEKVEIAHNASEALIAISKARGIGIISSDDSSYPDSLKKIKDLPPLVFIKGNPSFLKHPLKAALIGSRNSGPGILKLTERIGELLIRQGFTLVSGLALGCDRTAHLTAIKRGKGTIAVMPCGPDIIYPRENKFIFKDIASGRGLLLSEYAPGVHPAPFRFIERDRIQSGVSQVVVLMESSLGGGSMHTAFSALEQGRPLLVFKPDHFSEKNSGNKYLIEEKDVLTFSGPEDLFWHTSRIKRVLGDCHRESDQLLFPHV
jgi:DNA processing protein